MNIVTYTGNNNKLSISIEKDSKGKWVIESIYSDILNRQPLYIWSDEINKLKSMLNKNTGDPHDTVEIFANKLEKSYT